MPSGGAYNLVKMRQSVWAGRGDVRRLRSAGRPSGIFNLFGQAAVLGFVRPSYHNIKSLLSSVHCGIEIQLIAKNDGAGRSRR